MIDTSETQLFTSKISILTISRENFWIFKAGILEIVYLLADFYDDRSNSRYSDNDSSSLISSSDKSIDESFANLNVDNDEEHIFSSEIDDDGLFFHLAFTAEEVTLMCATKLINKYLSNAIKMDKESILISEEFFIIQVFSDGLNIGKKILELTQPLSLNNISLFFISNYFSDLVLVPIKDKKKALEILKNVRNDEELYQVELESKTFKLLKDNNIKPKLVTDVKLLLTGARIGDSIEILKQTAESISRLNTETFQGRKSFPEYFAITRTPTEEIGLLLPYDSNERNKLNYSKNNIMGSLEDYYYPIFVDLKKLPLDSKGIASGMASRLLREDINEMSYLSLGRSGIVLIPDMFRETADRILM